MIPTAKPAEICIFQYNQIKGTKQEPITPTAHQWLINPNSNTHRLEMLDQRAVEISNAYLAAYVDPVTGKL